MSVAGTFFVPSEWKPSLLVCSVMSLLFTLLFFVLSVIAEYLGQVFIEAKGRPTSLVYDFQPSDSASKRMSHEAL